MEILNAILLGIVQGITEWFPISSSGHLVIFQQLLDIKADLLFDVFLHFGSLVVLLIYFWKDILYILKAVFLWKTESAEFKIGINVILGSIPITLIGFFFYDIVAGFFESLFATGTALLFTGTILYLTKFAKDGKKMDIRNSILVGIAQAVALIPGISRSGVTISTGMLLGVERKDAARFSFLLAIPAIIGANIFEFSRISLGAIQLDVLVIGFIATVVCGYISLVLLMKIIEKGKFHYFSWYCWLLGLFVLVV